ncbi:MAG: flagellar basal body-associated FliL family protein [Clostridiaceae bacterium]|nr:flagellar basal body-associated FliL family protein [Clostridiaceae bacterium]
MFKKIIIIVLVVALIAAGVAYYLLTKDKVVDKSFNYDPGEYFVTDIQGSGSLLKTDIILHMHDSDNLEKLTENNHRIRSTIIFILRTKNEEELKGAKIEQSLRKEMLSALNKEFADDFEMEQFLGIYFNEFVIQ